MAKLTPSSQRPAARVMAGGVAGHQHPVGGQRGHGVVAALGDEVGGVLPQGGAPEVGGDGRVGLEVGDQLLGAHLGLGQVGEGQHHADAHGVGVGVEEAAAGDPPGAPEHLDVDALVRPRARTARR